MRLIDSVPLSLLVVVCLTLGLAPFFPEPHVVEKIRLLFSGELTRAIDIFDLLMHGIPWLLLGVKLVRMAAQRR
jgi:hypothetical protein